MRLVRIGEPGHEVPGVLLDEATWVDASPLTADFDGGFFGGDGVSQLRSALPALTAAGTHRLQGQRIGAPIARPHQILCIGLNYRDHAEETGQAIPAEPILFTKAPNTLVGPDDDVAVPRGSTKTDYEVELGVVIGRRTSYLADVEDATDAIAGYVLVNDVSEREFQMERGGQWSKGKSCRTFNPCGPWLRTSEEVTEPQDLEMSLDVNGVRRQTGNTRTMLFDVRFIVHYLSQFMVLEPGDLINTGTPPGVAMGMKPPAYLQAGDVVELSIEGLGTQRQRVVAEAPGNTGSTPAGTALAPGAR